MTDDLKWTKIMESEMGLEIEVASAALSDNDIPNVVIDKKDSAYVVIGRKELYVPREWVVKAKSILESGKDGD
jgi:hypothetical protein